MAEIDVDVFVYCDNDDCEYAPDDAEHFSGDDRDTFHWKCPECKTEYEFEIEFQPEVVGQRIRESLD
ncbi:hypothetical protein [Vibrio barjaei]|uniref:hypothetical protein n=1 Tax=Vibrio barjaei TaxID=1676683 RepID=UPI002283E36B|nr:hypothetical protein [Vibrio barjaei]MCY9874593.1 hypothetical protein [Vibrio barjaei]